MDNSDGIILESSAPSYEAVLRRDLAFHLGSREAYDLVSTETVCRTGSAPDDAFLCFMRSQPEFISGDIYRKYCTIADTSIRCSTQTMNNKQKRTIATVNRDFGLIHPDAPFACTFRDASKHRYDLIYGTEKPIPVFQYHRRQGLTAMIHPLAGYHDYPSRNIPDIQDTRSLRSKRARMFWRGNLTGRHETKRGPRTFGQILYAPWINERLRASYMSHSIRYALCRQSQENDALDAGLVIRWGDGSFKRPIASLQRLCRPRATIEDHLEHRYLLALDGYDGPSSHYWMLGTNSVVLRQESPWEMFGDCYFQPWVHYVPFAADGSDLFDIFCWCENNLAECEKIVRNARRAWSVLFQASYQEQRRRALLAEYASWVLD